jgi:transglutaminase-like putative cysteine protease
VTCICRCEHTRRKQSGNDRGLAWDRARIPASHHPLSIRPARYLSPHVVRLRPAPHTRTSIEAYTLKIAPEQHFLNWQQDPFGNFQARLVFTEPSASIEVTVDLVADLIAINPFDFFLEESAEKLPLRYEPALQRELRPYLDAVPAGNAAGGLIETCRTKYARDGRRTMDVLVDINQHIQRLLKYDIRMEPGCLHAEQTLTLGHGSCRDFAWLQCQVLRHLGFATRFASGYSIQLKPDEKPVQGPAGVLQDVADLHAWTEVFLPGAGWIGLDATSGLMAGEGHIPLACTPDPGSAAPVTGSYAWQKRSEDDTIKESLSFTMSVARLAEAPRSTKPYSDEIWSRIEATGQAVDKALEAQTCACPWVGSQPSSQATMPTRPSGTPPRWGARSSALPTPGAPAALPVRARWGASPRPGQMVPRRATASLVHRLLLSDGRRPIWDHADLLTPESDERPKLGTRAAEIFVAELAKRLGVDDQHLLPGYEDVLYYLWRERSLPVNLDPRDSRLDNELDRKRSGPGVRQRSWRGGGLCLAARARRRGRLAQRTLVPAAGAPVPAARRFAHGLPPALDSLPWVAPDEREVIHDPDPLAERPALPARVLLQAAPATQAKRERIDSGQGRLRALAGSHRALCGATQRCLARFPAALDHAGGLS